MKKLITLLALSAAMLTHQSYAGVTDAVEIDDVVEFLCSEDYTSQNGTDACKKIKHNEKHIVSGKWWKAPIRKLNTDNAFGITQFYSKNDKSTEGTVYHKVWVDGIKYTSSHRLIRSGNFNGGTWKRKN